MIKILWCLGVFLFAPLTSAENYDYQLKGAFKVNASGKSVEYTLQWAEKNGEIRGAYADNFFSPKSAEVSGKSDNLGRTLNVRFKEIKKGVRALTFITSVVEDRTATTIPISVITRDLRGNPLTTSKVSSNFVALKGKSNRQDSKVASQRQEDPDCREGFGLLANHCGVYSGLVAEESDRRNRCNLLVVDAVRFELTTEGMVFLHLGPVNDLVEAPTHVIGRIPYNPLERSIDMIGRVCASLAGVNSSSNSCKRVHLEGDFTTEGDTKHFKGTYTITEEDTNLLCRYTLSMNQGL